jgi:hypothetical protein
MNKPGNALAENFRDVWRLYAFDELLTELAPITHLHPRDRNLLRHHSQGEVNDRREIYLRETLDNLLSGCGVLEVGFLAGALVDEEQRCKIRLAPLLQLPWVRAYYLARYPLPLPPRFLSRIEHGGTVPEGASRATWFASLLSLDSGFRDGKLKQFLRIVDGFHVRGVTFKRLKSHVEKSDSILEAVTTPREMRTPMQECVAGLERFLLFCSDLCEVLDNVSDAHALRDATYDLYRYWFAVRKETLMDVVNSALSKLEDGEAIERDHSLPERAALQRLFEMAWSDPRDPLTAAETQFIKHRSTGRGPETMES